MADGSKGHHEKSQSLDINFRSVRDEINQKLHNAVGSSLTPYIGLERARKILAPYSIFIPATNYMEGSTGVRTFNVVQFDNIVGMTNDGKVETKTESPYHIYFDYVAGGGTYCCRCKLLTSDELEIYMDNYAGSANINEEKDKKEKKVHPLVARVKHAHISDAWMHARRNNDAKFMDTIRAKLKIKGLTVSDDEIKDSIKKFDKEKPMRPHKDKKNDLSEAIARYIERLDEGEKLSRRKSFTIARKFNSGMGGAYAINAAAGAGVGAVVPELGPAAGAAISTGMTLALHAKDFLKTYRRARKGGYFDGTYEHAKTMKEDQINELTAPTWKNTDKVLKRARNNEYKSEKEAFKQEKKADRSAMYSSIANKVGLTGLASRFKKKENEHEKLSNDAFHGTILSIDKQRNATRRRGSAISGKRPMKEESLVTESAKALEKQVRTLAGQRQPLDEDIINKTAKTKASSEKK